MYCADAYTSRSPCVAAHARIPLADSCLPRLASCGCAQPAPVIALTFLMAT
jgi:hypothetical protein